MAEADFSTPARQEGQQLADYHTANVFGAYTHEQLIAADREGSLSAMIHEANYDHDIDLADQHLDLPVVTGRVRQVIYEGEDIVRFKFSIEEQDEVLKRAANEASIYFRLTPGMLKTLRERRH